MSRINMIKLAKKRKRARIAIVRSSQGGDESLSNASANAYEQILREQGYDIDNINLTDVPYVDEWDNEFREKHKKRLKGSQATVFATPVYNWGPSARLSAYVQNAIKSGQDPYRPYAVLGAAGSARSQGYLHGLQNTLAVEDKGINVGAPLLATEDDVLFKGDAVKGVKDSYKDRLKEHALILGRLADSRLK